MIGERIVQLRKKKGISQTELAKLAGISREAVSKYERDDAVPSIETAAKIADILNVTIDYLSGKNHQLAVDKQTLKRIQDIGSLDDNTKGTLFTIIDTFIRDHKARQAYAS